MEVGQKLLFNELTIQTPRRILLAPVPHGTNTMIMMAVQTMLQNNKDLSMMMT